MNSPNLLRRHRLLTWYYFAGFLIAGVLLQEVWHEMHVSKMLFFGSFGVWARELPKFRRYLLLGMVGMLWLLILIGWYTYRNQHLVPMGKGVYMIENN